MAAGLAATAGSAGSTTADGTTGGAAADAAAMADATTAALGSTRQADRIVPKRNSGLTGTPVGSVVLSCQRRGTFLNARD